MLFQAIVLAIIEGVTEFLPISSTGHLILADEFVHLSDDDAFSNAFKICIQLPAIAAVVAYFWRALWPLGNGHDHKKETLQTWAKIGAAFLPAAVFGFLLDDFIEAKLLKPIPVALALIIGGVVLIGVEMKRRPPRIASLSELSYQAAIFIGLFQCLAMLPGTSRSAATIIGAMLLGASRAVAAEFSFFLAIPTMLGATVLTLFKLSAGFTSDQWLALAVGSLVSFLTAYAVIAFLMRYIQSRDFKPFGYYRIVLGVVVLWYFALV